MAHTMAPRSPLSASKAALQETLAVISPYPNTAVDLIAASGVVGNSLHMLLSPFVKGTAVYAWCDSTFTIAGAVSLNAAAFPKAAAIKILQLGAESAIIFSDGSVLAFPIPA